MIRARGLVLAPALPPVVRALLVRALFVLTLAAGPLAAQSSGPSLDTIGRSGVRVRYAPGDSLVAARVLDFLLDQPPLPGLPPGFPTVALVTLAPDEASFRRLTGGAPDWGAGVARIADREIVVPAYASARSAPGEANAVLRHEWAHLALNEYLGGLRIPRWFDEGYALLAENGFEAMEAWRLRVLMALERTPPLDSLTLDWPSDQASAEVAYLLAGSALTYLNEESGERGLRRLLERWRDGGALDPALRATYGVGVDQLEEDWRRWVRRRFGWLTVATHSAVIWTAFGVALIALTASRRRRDRERMARLRATEPADDPAYWREDPEPPAPD